MKPTAIATAERFHGFLETEFVLQPEAVSGQGGKRHLIVQERDVAYRFHLHQHPYVRQLMQRLLRKGTSGLQSADTENAAGGVSLPGSLEIELGQGVPLTLPAGSMVALLATVQATAGGSPIELAAHMAFRTVGEAAVAVSGGMRATMEQEVAPTPLPGTLFETPANSKAFVSGDTEVDVTGSATVVLHDGTPAALPPGTSVLLARGTAIQIPDGTQATLLKSKLRPLFFDDFMGAAYMPDAGLLRQPFPVKDLDFSSGGAYAIYNWELFFHAPMAIAIQLSKNQHFAEAQRWLHYLFDPTDNSEAPTPERYWKVRPFQTSDVEQIGALLSNLATGADETLRAETIRSIDAWKDAPFRPHVIARYRQQAYMYKTVMAYLDNLIAWGDSLFRQDTGEAIDEAMMIYVLAANILGPRPLPVPRKGTVRVQSYANMRQDLRQFGTVMRDVEADLPFDLSGVPSEDGGETERLASLRSLGTALYFCVPRNDKLLGYWDTVADRLFKIRNSLNFQGVFRQLALFEPPIDPALLARAAAAGLDVAAIVNGMNQPLPLVRFSLLVQKAAEICQEVKSLGSSLLAAMEKEDGEALTILRTKHERSVMETVEQVRYGQLQEAIKSKEGLLQSLALAVQRYSYYERQLGKNADEVEAAIPELESLDKDSLSRMRFAMSEPQLALREIEVDIDQDLEDSDGKIVSSYEAEELRKSNMARDIQDVVKGLRLTAQGLALLPDTFVDAHFWGVGGTIQTPGGQKFADVAGFAGDVALAYSDRVAYEAGQAARIGVYARREQEWRFQSNLAAGEIGQIFKQIRGAEIRQAISELELKSHRQQMKHAEEIERFLNEEGAENKGKKTNKALYAWMKREVKGLYSQSFQFAFDIAKKAERALQQELGQPDLSYLQYGYLAGKEGLLAGEKLYFDIKRMEMAYHDLNQREYELTRHISVLQVDPLALLQLRATGGCTVTLPEALFDMDGPGHYFRRIKTVAVSVPCVTGPYASVNCTLTLVKSSIRKTPGLSGEAYARGGDDDPRFTDYFGSLQSIVASSGQSDTGLFETSLRDERYLPFENSGVLSEWRLELPANPSAGEPRHFDYQTISDVILHIRYTAREGGALLKASAMKATTDAIDAAQAAGSVRLFSLRDEFPTEWVRFQRAETPVNQRHALVINLRPEHYPYWSQGRLGSVRQVGLLALRASDPAAAVIDVFDRADMNDPTSRKDSLVKDAALGALLIGRLTNIELPPKPVAEIKLFLEDRNLSDLWFAVTWGK